MLRKAVQFTLGSNAESAVKTLLGSNPRTVPSSMSKNVAQLSCAIPLVDAKMNEKQIQLMSVVMDMISDTLDNYEKDPHHAPATWILENWWATLQCVLNLSSEGPYESL